MVPKPTWMAGEGRVLTQVGDSEQSRLSRCRALLVVSGAGWTGRLQLKVAMARHASYALRMPICAQCGEDNPARARFCLACGSPLAASGTGREVRKTVTVSSAISWGPLRSVSGSTLSRSGR
jgi:ribosomal protein L40E